MKRHTLEEKLAVINEVRKGKTCRAIAAEFGIMHKYVIDWNRRYKLYGIDGLRTKDTCQRYTEKQKQEIIDQVLKNHISLPQVAAYYNVGETAIRRWIKQSGTMPQKQKGVNIKETSAKKGRRISSNPSGDIDKLMKENMSLKAELALLKKVFALVEERENPNR